MSSDIKSFLNRVSDLIAAGLDVVEKHDKNQLSGPGDSIAIATLRRSLLELRDTLDGMVEQSFWE